VYSASFSSRKLSSIVHTVAKGNSLDAARNCRVVVSNCWAESLISFNLSVTTTAVFRRKLRLSFGRVVLRCFRVCLLRPPTEKLVISSGEHTQKNEKTRTLLESFLVIRLEILKVRPNNRWIAELSSLFVASN
jgi:hypothetical protein